MRLIINGQEQDIVLEEGSSVAEVVRALGYSDDHFAVAVNRSVVLRRFYETTTLREGDAIEILTPMQGG